MKKNFILLLIFAMFMAVRADAQVTGYSRTPLTGQTYTSITGGTTINSNAGLGTGSDDDGGVVVTLPFSFSYDGNTYSTVTFCTNGWIAMGSQLSATTGVGSYDPTAPFITTVPNSTIAAWASDGRANWASSGPGSMVYGSAGAGIYAFEWKNASGNTYNSSTTNLINFMIKLYGPSSATPGRIEMLYGSVTATPSTGNSIAIEDATGGSGHFVNALNGSTTSTTTASAWPGSGTGYRFDPPQPCTATPIPGKTLSSTLFICPSTNFTLSLQNSISALNVAYQWQTSTDNIIWANVASGGTNPTYTAQQSATKYYRCRVTCSNTGGVAYSNPLKVFSTTNCYTAPSSSNCNLSDILYNVTMGTLNNTSTCGTAGYTNYSNVTPALAIPVYVNPSYSISTLGGAGGLEYTAVWIDYDHSGTFDTSEYTAIGNYNSNITSNYMVSNTVTIPGTAPVGYTMMRVRDRYNTALLNTDANTTYTYGETEDYMVHIGCPVVEFTTQPNDVGVCTGGNTSFTVATFGVGVSYQWQISTDNGVTWTNLSNTSPYSGATTATLTVTGATAGLNNNQYRVVASNTCSSALANSAPGILTINSTPVVGIQPQPQTICAGGNTTFIAGITGGAITYQWQVSTDAGVTWNNLSNAGPYSNVTTNILTITGGTIGLNNNQYRAVGNNGCYTGNTNGAVLTVNPLPAITSSPVSSTTICPLSNISFTAGASGVGISYQWQVSTDGGTTWNNLVNGAPYSNVTTATMTITAAPTTFNGYKYRAVASSSVCAPPVNSGVVTLTVSPAITFTQQPVNTIACEGSAATYTVGGISTNIAYQWQESPDASSWTSLSNTGAYSGVTTTTLSVVASMALHNKYYRCLVSSSCAAPTPSNWATLTVRTLPVVTSNPIDMTVCDGRVTTSSASFSITATGSSITYQWQVNSGSGFANVSGANYSGATSASLYISNPPPSFNANTYRCVVSGYCTPQAISNAATLTVNTRPIVTTQPANSYICSGDNATFTVVAAATAIAYQWQGYDYNSTTWVNLTNTAPYSNVNGATLTVATPSISLNGKNSFRCIISGTCSPNVTTNAVSHFMSTPPVIGTEPLDQGGCLGGTASFTVAATATTPTGTSNYQWQLDNGNGAGFVNLTNSAPYSTVTTSTLRITGVTAAMNGYQYRVIVSTSCNPPATSKIVKLLTQTLPAITSQPKDVSVCPGTAAEITIGATGTKVAYQWQVNTSSGFVNIAPANSIYGGANAAALRIQSPTVSMNGYKYRCIVSGACTPTLTSSQMNLQVYNPVSIVSQTVKDTACENTDKKIGLIASGNALIYQWQQMSSTPGIYTDILNVPPYSGANTDSLRIASITAGASGNIYRCHITEKILCNLHFYTNDIPVFVNPAPASTPPSILAQRFGTATFSVPASGTLFQWQENAQNKGFSDITDSVRYVGINTNTLTIKDLTTDLSGNQYRCVVNGICTNPVASKPSILTVDNALAITKVNASDMTMTVYPNPLSGTQLNINFSKTLKGKTSVRVLDKLGKLVYEGAIAPGQNNTASVELQALAAGVYLLQVSNEEGGFNQTVRFTKQ